MPQSSTTEKHHGLLVPGNITLLNLTTVRYCDARVFVYFSKRPYASEMAVKESGQVIWNDFPRFTRHLADCSSAAGNVAQAGRAGRSRRI
jgi:hypothetical protein